VIRTIDRRVALVVAGIVLLCALGAGAICVANFHTRSRAELLLADLRTIQVGRSTTQNVEAVVRLFPVEPTGGSSSDCPGADRSYAIRVADDTVNRLGFSLPALQRLGVRPWGAVALILLDHGRLCSAEYSVGASTGVDDQELRASTTIGSAGDPLLGGRPYNVSASLVRGHLHLFRVVVAPSATEEQRRHAFDFDLSCVSSFRGCRAVCELMPSAWLDYLEERRANGWPMPPEEAQDPRCKKLAGSE